MIKSFFFVNSSSTLNQSFSIGTRDTNFTHALLDRVIDSARQTAFAAQIPTPEVKLTDMIDRDAIDH